MVSHDHLMVGVSQVYMFLHVFGFKMSHQTSCPVQNSSLYWVYALFLSKASKGITVLNWQITCKSTSLHGHGHCRTSIASSRSQNRCQKECRNICQKVCRNICQIECHIECQSMCWKECQIEWQNKYAIYTSRLVYVRNYVRIVFQGVDHCFFSGGCHRVAMISLA